MYWIINDNIEFWPEHRKLISVHNADLNVVLTTPASRCLSLLLEAFPDVVAQQDFFTRVWEEEGMRVPTNTLYQNISIIRRGFRAVGDTTHSLIATVPRRGFKIHNDINIQNHAINSSTDAHTHNAPPAVKGNAGYKESIGSANNFNNKILKHIKSHLIMLSAFVIGAYSAYWLWNNNQPKP
ncbi:transcriptional regulator, partial [Escherichia coli]|nr:transcriptional regulator [Escherichia coli]